MDTIDSFTLYTAGKADVKAIAKTYPNFLVKQLKYMDDAVDLIPHRDITQDQLQQYPNTFVSDPQITGFDENCEEEWEGEEDEDGVISNDLFDQIKKAKSLSELNLDEIKFAAEFQKSYINTPVYKAVPNIGHKKSTKKAFLWHHNVMNIPEAWELAPELGKNIIIAHPDSGIINHRELCDRKDARILDEVDFDFVDMDDNAMYKHASHGLGTASVIMGNKKGEIKGVAPQAKLIPIRVAKTQWKGKPFWTPVLFSGGMRRLRLAIEHAIEKKADIISISLGGIKSAKYSRALYNSLKKAKSEGIIVLAAAGNIVRAVVYPAKYDNVIAVAGSNIKNEEWGGSSRGRHVDITAPAESVWKASPNNKIQRGSGTSYAVANTAGVAALWLSKHGKDKLIKEVGKDKIVDLFKAMLLESANQDHNLPDSGFGKGIVDAEALLKLDIKDFK